MNSDYSRNISPHHINSPYSPYNHYNPHNPYGYGPQYPPPGHPHSPYNSPYHNPNFC